MNFMHYLQGNIEEATMEFPQWINPKLTEQQVVYTMAPLGPILGPNAAYSEPPWGLRQAPSIQHVRKPVILHSIYED